MEESSNVEGGDTRLRIRLLAEFAVWVDGERIPDERWRLRRARSLVKLLALSHGHRLHRDQVADTLWPGSDLAASANNFHQTLYAARKVLEPAGSDCLRLEEGFLRLCCRDGQAPWVDVDQFEAAASEAKSSQEPDCYRAALDLYQGDLLPDDLYEDWTLQRREHLRQRHLGLQQALAQLLEARGDYSQAIEVITGLLSVDQVNEEVQAQLMRLYALSGKRAQALRQYQTLREALRREMDVEPGKATQQLFEDIQDNRFPPPQVSESPISLSYLTPAASFQNNLPSQLTSFIGREPEIAMVCQKVAQHRLVTLTGSGGVGKTRLALQSAEKLTEQFPHGVWLVELAPISDPTLVPRAVAETMRVPEQGGKEPQQTLVEYFQPRTLLLVMDNCEHVLAGVVPLVIRLLHGCPHLHILATSREILNMEAEMPFRCPSLSLPGERSQYGSAELVQSDAVRLFFERAGSTWPDFNVSEANATMVVQICRRLDGIPLAIELAAARVRMLSLEQIAARLDHAFSLLTGGSRSALPRHQTLRALIDWSYNLLIPQEKTLLRRMSVFAGGWTLEAAEEVCVDGEGTSGQLLKEQIIDLLGGLIDKSLVQFETIQEEPRYRMLETVRQYSRERLLEAGEDEWTAERHLDYFLALSQRAEPHLRTWGMVAWLDRLERELDNLRLALTTSLLGSIEKGLQLAACLMWFWHVRGHRVEGVRWIERLLQAQDIQHGDGALDCTGLVARGRALYTSYHHTYHEIGLATFSQTQKLAQECHAIFQALREAYPRDFAISCFHKAETAEELLESRKLFQELNDPFWTAQCDQDLPERFPALDERAFFYCEEGLALRKGIGDLDGEGQSLFYLGYLELCRGNVDRLIELSSAAVTCFETVGNRWGGGLVLNQLARFYTQKGDYQEALRQCELLLRVAQELNNKSHLYEYLIRRAYISWAIKEYDQAIRYCEEAQELGRNFSYDRTVFADYLLCRAFLSKGEIIQARSSLQRLFRPEIFWVWWGIAYRAIQTLGLIAAHEGQMQQAATWFGAQDVRYGHYGWLLENLSVPERSEYEQAQATVRAALGDEAFTAALEAGRAMTIEQILQSALEATGEKLSFRAEPEGSTRTTAG